MGVAAILTWNKVGANWPHHIIHDQLVPCGALWPLGHSPGQILRQLSAIDFTSHRVGHVTSASRQHQLSHVSHENVTQNPNPFQCYLQCLGNFTSLACASPPNLPRRFACLRARTALQMRLQHCPPISVLTTPALTIFMLTWCPPNMPPTPLAILTLVYFPPDMLLTLLTILTLVECPPNMLPTPPILTLV
ncbi:hypothetical protein O181_057340 [Austropuccinia psidii MF-1]|uniref:Uncharacterized protein n=1 Tax=Austropuccinia psidii MF-1 TaxID=1389203 RepID=A0A9Q3EEG3_9BASI|nr:hypothetical protein [Austropuccinia psidii MF-1]